VTKPQTKYQPFIRTTKEREQQPVTSSQITVYPVATLEESSAVETAPSTIFDSEHTTNRQAFTMPSKSTPSNEPKKKETKSEKTTTSYDDVFPIVIAESSSFVEGERPVVPSSSSSP